MLVPPADSWKLVLGVALLAAVMTSAWARPPRRSVPRTDLRWLVLGALALYGVGLAASLTRHTLLAVVLYAGGIAVSSLAAWLSRGVDSRGKGPDDGGPVAEPPPPAPDGAPTFDWDAFERELESYLVHRREPARLS